MRAVFSYCSSLTALKIPDSVKTLKLVGGAAEDPDTIAFSAETFGGCTALKKISIGKGLKTVFGGYTDIIEMDIYYLFSYSAYLSFDGCTALEQIAVSPDNKYYASLGGVLYNKTFTKLVYVPDAIKGTKTLPSTVKGIENVNRKIQLYFGEYLTIVKYSDSGLPEKNVTLMYKCGSGFDRSYNELLKNSDKNIKKNLKLSAYGHTCNVFITNKAHTVFTTSCKRCACKLTGKIASVNGKNVYTLNGKKVNGFVKLNGYWHYYVNDISTLSAKKINGSYYYFSKRTGIIYNKGLLRLGKNCYFFGSDGKMVINKTLKLGKNKYTFGKNGYLTKIIKA